MRISMNVYGEQARRLLAELGNIPPPNAPKAPNLPKKSVESRVCGGCGRFHTDECQHPMNSKDLAVDCCWVGCFIISITYIFM